MMIESRKKRTRNSCRPCTDDSWTLRVCNHGRGSRRSSVRSGITLTEVLIAIGVAAVGMFGVFVLIPMCARQAELGQVYDEASAMSRTAVARVETNGMADPSRWRRTRPSLSDTTFPIVVDANGFSFDGDAIPDWQQNSFCLDPQALIEDPANYLFPHPAWYPTPPAFGPPPPPAPPEAPKRRAGQRYIERISYDTIFSTNAAHRPRLAALGRHLFQATDDLKLDYPVDKQELPDQQYVLNATNNPVVRTVQGKMSWFAMFEPQPQVVGSDLYRMYVVVLKNRTMVFKPATPEDRATEEFVFDPYDPVDLVNPPSSTRTNDVIFPAGAIAISGGDLTVRTRTTLLPKGNSFRRNGWVMLQSEFDQSIFAWYRIVRAVAVEDVDETDAVTVDPGVHLTVEGGDWPLNLPSATPAGLGIPRIVYIPEVVMVYEKTIKLGDDSLFSVN